MKITFLPLLLLGLILTSCASQPGSTPAASPHFSITTKNPDDVVTVQAEQPGVVIDVISPRGIGSAALQLESGDMPQVILVRLHLTGLEALRVSAGDKAVSASVSSGDPLRGQSQVLVDAGGETSLTTKDELWLDIQIVSGEAEAKIPLTQGYFEVRIPAELIEGRDSFELSWIDFYR